MHGTLSSAGHTSLASTVASLRAAGEVTRLRILALLDRQELSVKDLTEILGQSQPRISRHLKLLTEAGLILRFPEGAWAYYVRADEGVAGALGRAVLDGVFDGDVTLARDRERLLTVKAAHATAAAAYFAGNAADWDRIRSLHQPEASVEAAILEAVGNRPFGALLDLGTGTGRMLELLAPFCDRALGIDASHDMLGVARVNLDRARVAHAQVRHGDVYDLNVPAGAYDLVVVHQVLHYLDDPARALVEARRALRPGGRLLVVDFAPHALEFLRSGHAHRRLGISHDHMARWLEQAGFLAGPVRDLAPTQEAGLTVSLWLASNSAASAEKRAVRAP